MRAASSRKNNCSYLDDDSWNTLSEELSALRPCQLRDGPYTRKGVTYSSSGAVTSSLFASIASGQIPPSGSPPSLLHRGPSMSAFAAASPCSKYHVLVVTRSHVASHLDLAGAEGLEVLDAMVSLGESLAAKAEVADPVLGFHTPPWNSVDHIHMHVIDPKGYVSWKGWVKFAGDWTPWFCSAKAVRRRIVKEIEAEEREEGRRREEKESRDGTGPPAS